MNFENSQGGDERTDKLTRRTMMKSGAVTVGILGLEISEVEAETNRGGTTNSVSGSLPINQQAKLAAKDGDSEDNFGFSVALDGNTALIGAPDDEDPNGDRGGSAYVFTSNSGSWNRGAKLAANDGNSDDTFGWSVAIDGDTALIGANGDEDPNGDGAGSAYVFTRDEGTWSQQTKLAADDGDSNDLFGFSVALDGDTALIGAPEDDDPNGVNAGSAYVFERNSGNWTQRVKLAASDGGIGHTFGFSVALDGDTVLVGASEADTAGLGSGAVYVFTRNGGGWSQQAKLTADDGDSFDSLGWSAALDGDTALMGAPDDEDPNGDRAGSAYVFTRDNGTWSQQAKLAANDGDSEDTFGWSVAIDGDTAVSGAQLNESPNGERAGSAYVFTRGGGSWIQQSKLAANDGDKEDQSITSTAA